MTDARMLQLLIELSSHLADFNKREGSAYNILYEGVLDNIRTKENKRKGCGKIDKLAKDIIKSAKKGKFGKQFHGAWIDSKGRQVVSDGHRILWINNPIELPTLEEGIKPFDSSKLEINSEDCKEIDLPDLADIKTNIKLIKAQMEANKRYPCTVALSVNKQICLNAEFVAKGVECLGTKKLNFTSKTAPCCMETELGTYLIIPINGGEKMYEEEYWGI